MLTNFFTINNDNCKQNILHFLRQHIDKGLVYYNNSCNCVTSHHDNQRKDGYKIIFEYANMIPSINIKVRNMSQNKLTICRFILDEYVNRIVEQ